MLKIIKSISKKIFNVPYKTFPWKELYIISNKKMIPIHVSYNDINFTTYDSKFIDENHKTLGHGNKKIIFKIYNNNFEENIN